MQHTVDHSERLRSARFSMHGLSAQSERAVRSAVSALLSVSSFEPIAEISELRARLEFRQSVDQRLHDRAKRVGIHARHRAAAA